MNKFALTLTILVALGLAAIFAGIHEQWIIIRNPSASTAKLTPLKKLSKIQYNLSYWNKNKWQCEQTTLLASDNQSHIIKQLINSWLNLIEEEQIFEKKVVLESALISASGQELFLSFSRTLFGKNEPLIAKWMRIEGILKTIRQNNNQIQWVRFLVHHQPLRDTQLDFSFSWPIQGFVTENER